MRGVVATALALAACDGASPDPGLTALLQVEGAQFRPGPFPADAGGPAALGVSTLRGAVVIDRFGERLDATLEPEARGVAIGIAGAEGSWLIRPGVPDLDTPGLPSAKATFGLAADFPIGPFTLQVAASDAAGRFGPAATTMLIANPEEPPRGELVIALRWDGGADLDLHVVDALGGEAWADDPNTLVTVPGVPVDPAEYARHGILDRDGNRACVRDGRPHEHVIWTMPPPTGNYIVRVDARSLCGDPIAYWNVAAYRAGELIGAARGVASGADVLQPHGAGAGILALRFALP